MTICPSIAVAYRASLLIRRPPDGESLTTPATCSTCTRLLERGRLSNELGGGTDGLPIIEPQAGDVSATSLT